MPTYVYQAIDPEKGCEHCKDSFEWVQPISEAALIACPQCSAPIHRVIQPVGITLGKKYLLSEQNMKKHGFSKLVNEGDGRFRKI